jgi:precorrin-6x reductase
MKSHFWDVTESATTVRSLDIGQMNAQKRQTGTPEDETITTIETFPEEEEVEAMAETRILNLRATVTTAESRDMPKQPVGCF